ncbi:hypothetical protein [Saccharothrix deserti]|uniref:hypothetical protein n=1 Tax=Saccharothrix deserti TaxID=2593674 RepID=UPI00131DA79C|nr:hypothetical protein [Saccharothrix deserti]
MHEDELVRRLRAEAGFRTVPLLDTDARVVGLHLHRFLPGGVLDVVQIRDSTSGFHTVRAQLINSFSVNAPFAPPAALARDQGALAEVAAQLLLPVSQCPSNVPAWPPSDASGA